MSKKTITKEAVTFSVEKVKLLCGVCGKPITGEALWIEDGKNACVIHVNCEWHFDRKMKSYTFVRN